MDTYAVKSVYGTPGRMMLKTPVEAAPVQTYTVLLSWRSALCCPLNGLHGLASLGLRMVLSLPTKACCEGEQNFVQHCF